MNAYAISIISQLIAMALLAGVLIVNMYLASYSNAKKRIADHLVEERHHYLN